MKKTKYLIAFGLSFLILSFGLRALSSSQNQANELSNQNLEIKKKLHKKNVREMNLKEKDEDDYLSIQSDVLSTKEKKKLQREQRERVNP